MKLSEVREHSKKQVLKNGTQDFKRLENVLDKLNTIKIIDLYDAWIGDEGAIILAEALKYNTSITSIDLASTRMCDEGLIALSEALRINKTIQSINLISNEIGNEGAIALAEDFETNLIGSIEEREEIDVSGQDNGSLSWCLIL